MTALQAKRNKQTSLRKFEVKLQLNVFTLHNDIENESMLFK